MNDVDGFLHLSSILQSATKYCIDWLRNKAVNHLAIFWPNTLQGWLDVPGEHKSVPIPHPALVVNLARKVDLPIFLPIALYRLGRLSTCEAHEADLTSGAGPIPKTAYCLSREDVLNHLRYQERTALSARCFIGDFLETFESDPTCTFTGEDINPCDRTFEYITSYLRRYIRHITPLGFVELALDKQFSLCSACRDRFDAAVKGRRQALWDELPGWFGLPSWQVLMAGFPEQDVP